MRGIYLASEEDAFDEAIRTWRDLLAAGDLEEERDSTIEISDADGTVIAWVPLGFAQRLRPD